jgi:hypothetical protein
MLAGEVERCRLSRGASPDKEIIIAFAVIETIARVLNPVNLERSGLGEYCKLGFCPVMGATAFKEFRHLPMLYRIKGICDTYKNSTRNQVK